MEHSTKPVVKKLDPPLARDEEVDVYFSSVGKRRQSGHASAILFYRSSGESVDPILWLSLDPRTNSQRGNIGAIITILEWIETNEAWNHPITVYTVEEYLLEIFDQVGVWVSDKKKKGNRHLYQKILLHRTAQGKWPRVCFMLPEDPPHVERHAHARALAYDRLVNPFAEAA